MRFCILHVTPFISTGILEEVWPNKSRAEVNRSLAEAMKPSAPGMV